MAAAHTKNTYCKCKGRKQTLQNDGVPPMPRTFGQLGWQGILTEPHIMSHKTALFMRLGSLPEISFSLGIGWNWKKPHTIWVTFSFAWIRDGLDYFLMKDIEPMKMECTVIRMAFWSRVTAWKTTICTKRHALFPHPSLSSLSSLSAPEPSNRKVGVSRVWR